MADAGQNFTDMFKKFGEQLKVPSFDMAKIMEHQQKNLEAMTKSWQAVAGGASEIAQKQRAIFEAAAAVQKETGETVEPEVMIPLVAWSRELAATAGVDLPVTLYEAVLGAKVRVPTLGGAYFFLPGIRALRFLASGQAEHVS